MKKKEKRMILILVIVSILIVGVIWLVTRPKTNKTNTTGSVAQGGTSSAAQGEFTKVDNEGTIVNTSEKINKDREELGFSITNVKLEEKNGETIISARITNKTDSNQESFFGNIILLDKQGNEIGRIPTMVSETQKGESIDIEASITESYANAYDFKLEK